MWVLADLVRQFEREKWRRDFGTEFTGMHEGRPVRLVRHQSVIGHVCVGDDPMHLRCLVMYGDTEWRWRRIKG